MENDNGEHLVRVEAWSELCAGLLIWILPCPYCGLKHRGILLRWYPAEASDLRITMPIDQEGWSFDPPPACMPALPLLIPCIPREAVASGRIYRVVVDEPRAVERERELERVR